MSDLPCLHQPILRQRLIYLDLANNNPRRNLKRQPFHSAQASFLAFTVSLCVLSLPFSLPFGLRHCHIVTFFKKNVT
jgi:hypothetical protein